MRAQQGWSTPPGRFSEAALAALKSEAGANTVGEALTVAGPVGIATVEVHAPGVAGVIVRRRRPVAVVIVARLQFTSVASQSKTAGTP